jgi:hypothetical protein
MFAHPNPNPRSLRPVEAGPGCVGLVPGAPELNGKFTGLVGERAARCDLFHGGLPDLAHGVQCKD